MLPEPTLGALQARFRTALLAADDAPLAPFLAPGGAVPLARRVAVHRNTVYGTLTEALAAAFPVVRRLVGDAFFAAAARAFITAAPPERPDLAAYGGGFPAFLDGFPPAAAVPYLGDVGRLEWARVEATFAADAPPLSAERLAAVPAQELGRVVLHLVPSARAVGSRWPVLALWDAHQTDEVGAVDLDAGPDRLLILRQGDRLVTLRLEAGAEAFVAALAARRPLAEAAGSGAAADPGFDLQGTLAALLVNGALADLTLLPEPVP